MRAKHARHRSRTALSTSVTSIAVIAAIVVIGRAAPAGAQPTPADKALAETLFRDGKALMEADRMAEACAKLSESQRIDPKLGTQLNLAACYEKEGKTASAWAEFTEAASIAVKQEQEERAEFARSRAANLEARLSKLRIEVAVSASDMQIKLNRRTLSAAALGSSIPVDPGAHSVEVTAPGKKPYVEHVRIQPGPITKRLLIPKLEDDDERAVLPPPPAPPAEDREPAVRSGGGGGALRILAYVAGGVGLAGIGVGTAFGIRTLSKASEVEKNCIGFACNKAGVEANDAAYTSATISTLGFGAGAAFLGAGVALFVISRPSAGQKDAARVWILPDAGREGAGLAVGGRF